LQHTHQNPSHNPSAGCIYIFNLIIAFIDKCDLMCLCVYVFMCLVFFERLVMNKKVYVSERAVFARVKRALASDGKVLRICRENSRYITDLGRYYAVDLRTSLVLDKDLQLAKYARKIGVLKAYEEVKD
jgi:hypothetical protein